MTNAYRHGDQNNTMNPLTPHNFGRHGEVILKPVKEVPKEAKLVAEGANVIIGHSESGHHHVLTIQKEAQEEGVTIRMYEHDGKTYLDLPARGTLTHQKTTEKHETQIFQPGIYIREIRQSYSYAERVMRRVQD